MARFIIAPQMRLHEWVAEEKGYFAEAGLSFAPNTIGASFPNAFTR
jgi:hypothetical protein